MTLVIWSCWEKALFSYWLLQTLPHAWVSRFSPLQRISMSQKTGSWIIAIGAVIMFLGLCFLPALLGPHGDQSLLGAASGMFSFGTLMIAGGIYLKARTLQGRSGTEKKKQNSGTNGKRYRGASCDLCGKAEPVILCRVHEVHLCADCLAQHYNFRSCAYVPTNRRQSTGQSGKSVTVKARGA